MPIALAALAHAAIVGAVFLLLWSFPGSDDYAGWSPAIAALGVPAWLIIAFARGRLGWGGAAALGVPAALCLGGVTTLMLWPLLQVVRLDDEVVLLALLLLGPGAALLMAVIFCRRLHGQVVRTAARRVVVVVAASGAAALLAASPGWWGFWDLTGLEGGGAVLFFLFGALPLGWSIGPALALLATREPASPA